VRGGKERDEECKGEQKRGEVQSGMRKAKKRRGEESEQKTRFPLTNLQFTINNA
jgi:hypothetical protein